MLLEILKDFALNPMLFIDRIHSRVHSFLRVFYVVCEHFTFSLSFCYFHINCLENVQLAARVEDGFLELIDPSICLLVLLVQPVDVVLVTYKLVLHRLYKFL